MRILATACFDERGRARISKVPYIYDFKSSHLKLRNSGTSGQPINIRDWRGF